MPVPGTCWYCGSPTMTISSAGVVETSISSGGWPSGAGDRLCFTSCQSVVSGSCEKSLGSWVAYSHTPLVSVSDVSQPVESRR